MMFLFKIITYAPTLFRIAKEIYLLARRSNQPVKESLGEIHETLCQISQAPTRALRVEAARKLQQSLGGTL